MNSPIRFDDSLPAFAKLIKAAWGDAAVNRNLFLRDASGRLTFVLVDDSHSQDDRADLAMRAAGQLGAYVDDSGFALATPEQLFDDTLKDLGRAMTIRVDHDVFKGEVHLVDRRMVGADWLRTPVRAAPAPARFVFASLKGGVGRSTALSVLAARLASRGRRVLAVDMDLEAPGLGNILLPEGTLPTFGLLDYLVEAEVGSPLDDQFFADLIGPSWLGQGRGRVDVIPAIGRSSLRFPANVLAKIARAYLAAPGTNGELRTFADQLRILIDRYADPLRYDAILVDSRAGLHETTAAAVVGLGAEVLLFGLDQPQTFSGYELLFAHLSSLPPDPDNFWPERLHIIHSKAPRDLRRRSQFAERMLGLLKMYLWPQQQPIEVSANPSDLRDTFDVEWTEETENAVETLIRAEQPPPVVSILDDDHFRSFDPINDRDSLADQYYSVTFGEFLSMAEGIVTSYVEPEGKE